MPPIVMGEVINHAGLVAHSFNGGEALGNKPPFLVSAHHLITIGKMLREGLTPAGVVDQDVSLLEEHRNRSVWKLGGRRRRQANDRLGNTLEDEIKYKRTGTDFLTNFNKLDDEDVIKIGNGQRDWWDEGFSTKEYSFRYYHIPPFRVMNDPVIINVFAKIVKKIEIDEDKIQLISETAVFSNKTNPRPVISLITTAGVVRQVLSSEEFQKEIHLSIRP